jgi:hypothetical protein
MPQVSPPLTLPRSPGVAAPGLRLPVDAEADGPASM